MIAEKAFEQLMGLDDGWEVAGTDYEQEEGGCFVIHVRETSKLWPKLPCPDPPSAPPAPSPVTTTPRPASGGIWTPSAKRHRPFAPPGGCQCGLCQSVFPVPLPFPVKAEQVLRLNEDKAFGHEAAAADFGFKPREFADGVREEIAEMGLKK